jgi:CRISPR/Cas system-associated endoribonuclease Cas2
MEQSKINNSHVTTKLSVKIILFQYITIIYYSYFNGEVYPEQAMKVKRESRSIALLFL